jgi:hypothetical protein
MTPAELVGLSVPVLLNMTRTLQAAKPWWGAVLPPKYQWIPGVVIAATTELIAKLTMGVSSWMDIVLPMIVVSALFAPGARSAAHASVAAVAKREAFGNPDVEEKIALAEGSIRPPKLEDEPPPTKRPPTFPLAMLMLVLACLALSACATFPSSQGSECSETSLGLIVADCKLKVGRECGAFTDETIDQCPAVQECDARVDAWEACK